MNQLIALVLSVPGILIATMIHEFSRAAVSTGLGDRLPKINKRLTLNPFNHFEPIGFILMLVTGFGWGKPVNTSPSAYRNKKRGIIITAVLPTVINFCIAPVFLILWSKFYSNTYLAYMFRLMFQYNVSLALYNLWPVSPMDCAKVLTAVLPTRQRITFTGNEKLFQMIFLLLLFFGVIGAVYRPFINLGLTFWVRVLGSII